MVLCKCLNISLVCDLWYCLCACVCVCMISSTISRISFDTISFVALDRHRRFFIQRHHSAECIRKAKRAQATEPLRQHSLAGGHGAQSATNKRLVSRFCGIIRRINAIRSLVSPSAAAVCVCVCTLDERHKAIPSRTTRAVRNRVPYELYIKWIGTCKIICNRRCSK